MPEASARLPALTLRLQLQGLATLGLDSERVRTRLGPIPDEPDALVPVQTYLDMWEEAERLYGLPGLPSALAQAKTVWKASDVHPLGYPTVEAIVRMGKKLETATKGRIVLDQVDSKRARVMAAYREVAARYRHTLAALAK